MRNLEQMPPAGRVFIRDWPKESFAEYEKLHPIEGDGITRPGKHTKSELEAMAQSK
jgi:hypothetical protein